MRGRKFSFLANTGRFFFLTRTVMVCKPWLKIVPQEGSPWGYLNPRSGSEFYGFREQNPLLTPKAWCYPRRSFRFLYFSVADFKLLQLGCNLFGPGSVSALKVMLWIRDRNLLIFTTVICLKRKALKTNDVMASICSQLLFAHLFSVWKKHLTIFLMNVTRSFCSAGALH